MKKYVLTLLVALAGVMNCAAQKSIYVPYEWIHPWKADSLIYKESDPENKYTWSKSRSKESENYIVYWDKDYGNTLPSNAASAYRVDIDDLLAKAEGFYALNVGTLAFCDESKSNVSKYKMMILLNHTTDWVCYGAGYDDVIGALWLSPSTCKPVGHSVAHEVGHSFQYQVFCDLKGFAGFRTAIGSGATFWEQTAQWQANQSYPGEKWSQSWGMFQKTHNLAMTHEEHRYQSYWWHYYLVEKYGIDIIARLWRHDSGKGVDPNENLMKLNGMTVKELYGEYFHYAMRMATLDIDGIRDEAAPYIGTLKYDYTALGGAKYQVAYSSCPQSTGFNVIPLNVPKPGTEIQTEFTSIPRNGYNSFTNFVKRGFRLGYVALKKDGERQYFYEDSVYCTGNSITKDISCTTSFTVPENVERLFMVVSPAPTAYFQHQWDDNPANDDQWPYTVEFTGTNIHGAADIEDGRAIGDATISYDVYFAKDNAAYSGVSVKVDGEAMSALGTALQMQASNLHNVMKPWNSAGPQDGEAMFYAVNANGTISNTGSSANGYGHWFTFSGNRTDWATGYLFSEFNPETLVFSIGQYPGKLTNNKDYTIRQAVKYVRGSETAVVTFVFNIHVTTARTGFELSGIESSIGTAIRDLSSAPLKAASVTYSLGGMRQPANNHGINIETTIFADGTRQTRKIAK